MRLPTRKGARSRAGSARATWLAALGATFAVGLTSSAFQVQEGTNVVVLRFGDPSRVVTEPGLHFKLPAPIDTLQRIDVRTHVLDPAPSEFLTLEQRNLEIDAFVAWRVRDPRVFLTSLRDRGGADVRIEQVLQSAVNDVLTETPLADIVSVEDRERELEDVAAEVTELVAKSCEENGYGVEVLLVGFERVTFHRDNMPAIESSMEEERRSEATNLNTAGRERAAEVSRSAKLEGNALRAEALSNAEKIRGEGEAEAYRILQEARSKNPALYDLLQRLELLEPLLGGQTILITQDHWFFEGLNVPAPGGSEDPGESEEPNAPSVPRGSEDSGQ